MKSAITQKFDSHTAAFDWERAMGAATFAEFDDAVTAPLHGFSGKDEYYDKCSSIDFLKDIDRPTLIINSRDDPFMLPKMLPEAHQLSEQVTLEISEEGGHVGFVAGGTPWNPQFYLPGRIIDFLQEQISQTAPETHALPSM
jgi:predicted alpha/beta-fold hydrolase